MPRTERVKHYVLAHYVNPAGVSYHPTATARAGDVNRAMGLKSGQPALCQALGANEFETFAHVKRACVMGPLNGANCVFVFKLL